MREFEAHILVVDDDSGIRELVKEYLNQNNFITSTAKDAEDATRKTKLIKFDLIILDIMMPGKSGLEFINENKDNLETPIILLTAKGQPNERIEGLEVGADDPDSPSVLFLFLLSLRGRGLGASQRNGPPPTPLTLRACGRSSSLTSNETYSSFTSVLNVLTLGQIFCW